VLKSISLSLIGGADISLMPGYIAEEIGLDWEKGQKNFAILKIRRILGYSNSMNLIMQNFNSQYILYCDGKTEMRGIAQKKECNVYGRIHEINVIIPDLKLEIQIPVCFVKGNTPFLLGREGFFDYFKITFEKEKLRTVFELVED